MKRPQRLFPPTQEDFRGPAACCAGAHRPPGSKDGVEKGALRVEDARIVFTLILTLLLYFYRQPSEMILFYNIKAHQKLVISGHSIENPGPC
jgi:hypothetical protein